MLFFNSLQHTVYQVIMKFEANKEVKSRRKALPFASNCLAIRMR
ncbi:hypothetical protein HMPREF0971_03136 [Segatella oris F0302]|uniref:Uncharacterized protein n=1 Tax=Segatella oris F0302 TaxID=649760 RepID=D1QVU5_9BACT|nr:hypothetical protein HMPREF0971_03136 [Segatella oris F0302]